MISSKNTRLSHVWWWFVGAASVDFVRAETVAAAVVSTVVWAGFAVLVAIVIILLDRSGFFKIWDREKDVV